MNAVHFEKLSPAVLGSLSADVPAEVSDKPLLPDPCDALALDADVGAQVAALVIKNAKAQKSSERECERAAEDAQDAAEQAQVADMHAKASHAWKEAVLSGVAQMASGVLSACAAGAGQETVTVAEKSVQKSVAGTLETTTSRTTVSVGSLFQAGAKGVEGAGTLAAGYFKSEHAIDEANAARHEHAANHAKRASDDARDRVKDATKLVDEAISFYREYATAQAAAQKAAIHGA